MTPREDEEREEGILERMLERLKCIGEERKNDDEWSLDELYNNENGEY
jgi:hypothetical protein